MSFSKPWRWLTWTQRNGKWLSYDWILPGGAFSIPSTPVLSFHALPHHVHDHLPGNSLLIIISILDSCLHTPMYFFLGNLSFLDICYTSSSIPPMLIIFRSERKSISFIGCALKMVVSLGLCSTECVLLAVMAYDRYVAISNPLSYLNIIMSRVLYVHMATWSWIIGCLISLLQTIITMILPFCGNNFIDHMTCEILALLKLICSDITINVIIMTVTNIVILVIPILLIFISYVFILSSILRINSAEGRKKVFSILFNPPEYGHLILWFSPFYVHEAQVKGHKHFWWDHWTVLWSSNPNVEPHHLHLKK